METKGSREQLTYQKGNETYSVDLSQIVYLESTGRKVKVVTQNGVDVFYGKIQAVYKILNRNVFWQIHQSILINCNMVRDWDYEAVIMKTGESLPISQSRRKEIHARVRLMGKKN